MATVYDKSSLFLAPSGVNDGTVFVQKPVPIYGPELVTNGDFDTDSDWNVPIGWTISGGVATCDGTSGTGGILRQSNAVPLNTKLYASIEITNYVSGTVQFKFAPNQYNLNVTKNGIYTVVTNGANSTNGDLQIISSGFVGSIDNVSVKEVLKPSADFTFSRGSNLSATRVDVNGLIEKGRENLLTYSNTFSNSAWARNDLSVTSGQSGYDGSSDAWLLEANSTTNTCSIRQNISTSGVQTFSVYVKAGTTDWIRLNLSGIGNRYFDINNGVVGSSGSLDGFVTDIGDGWFRCSVLGNGSSTAPYVFLASADGSVSVNTGDNILIQDAQLEAGLVATDYIETGASTAQAGILEDMPRLDYSGGATCPSLLLEPSRTQLVPYTEYIDGLILTDLTTTPNATTSPEGVQNAYKVLTGTAGSEQIASATSGTSGNIKTQSVYVKADSGVQWIRLIQVRSGFSNSASTHFDIQNGVKGSKEENGTTSVVDDATKIEDAGNGWYRLTLVCTDSTNNTIFDTRIRTAISDGSGTRVSNGSYFVWGLQMESNASYPTSYIPNHSGGSITRIGDASLAQSYNYSTSNNYTLFFDFNLADQPFLQNQVSKTIRSQSLSNFTMTWRWFHTGGSHCFVPYFNIDAVYPFGTNTEANRTDNGKVVMSVSGGTYKLFLRFGGTTTMRTTTGKTAAPFNKFNLMQDAQKERINQIVFFDTTLSDTDCEILTGATTYETFEEMALALNYTVYE